MTTVDLSPEDLSGLVGLVYDSAFEEVQWKSFLRRMCQMFQDQLATDLPIFII